MSISNPAWWGIIGVAWVAAVGPGDFEGYLHPPVTPLEIASQEPKRGGVIIFDGKTERLRPECNFVRVEWFIGTRNGAHVPTIVKTEKPSLRPAAGVIDINAWSVYVGVQRIENTFADVFHECRWGSLETPWSVKTEFYN